MSNKRFYHGDGIVRVTEQQNPDFFKDVIKPDFYQVCFNSLTNEFYLEVTEHYGQVPVHVYGEVQQRSEKVLSKFQRSVDSDKTVGRTSGALITGMKGTGKTMLANFISSSVVNEMNLPVIVINSQFSSQNLSDFVKGLGPCCILFDEFGKFYSSRDDADGASQGGLLSLFDGSDGTPRLILCTENSISRINDFILDRPGRLTYHFEYRKLSDSVIEEFCDMNGFSSIKDFIKTYKNQCLSFGFDALEEICEEFGSNHATDPEFTIEKFVEMVKELNVESFNSNKPAFTFKKAVIVDESGNPGEYEKCKVTFDRKHSKLPFSSNLAGEYIRIRGSVLPDGVDNKLENNTERLEARRKQIWFDASSYIDEDDDVVIVHEDSTTLVVKVDETLLDDPSFIKDGYSLLVILNKELPSYGKQDFHGFNPGAF